jgi:hypothetical protein
MELSDTTEVVASRYLVGAEVGDEIILLHLENGHYFGLDDVSARIWKLLQKPTTVRDIEHALLEEYEIESGRCHEEVMRLLSDLIEQGLVERTDV